MGTRTRALSALPQRISTDLVAWHTHVSSCCRGRRPAWSPGLASRCWLVLLGSAPVLSSSVLRPARAGLVLVTRHHSGLLLCPSFHTEGPMVTLGSPGSSGLLSSHLHSVCRLHPRCQVTWNVPKQGLWGGRFCGSTASQEDTMARPRPPGSGTEDAHWLCRPHFVPATFSFQNSEVLSVTFLSHHFF